jgi:ABC-type spermidine/putrescine transport system permease subunit II
MDLAASALGAVRRVLLKMLLPAILATTILRFASLLAVVIGFALYRWLTRGEKGGRTVDVFAGEA